MDPPILPPDAIPGRNRLVFEKSPYLLQHAKNPVDWHPWGEAAFEKARREDKPVFLSIGYSTCHWCHVMARESFEDEEIAAVLNEHFVAIKVDREERPDVDKAYMAYVQAATGAGGWPLSVWLTPDRKPFAGGTYFPPRARWGRPGFKGMLLRIAESWDTDRARMAAAGESAVRLLRQTAAAGPDVGSAEETVLLDAGYREFKAAYEPLYGGFGMAPKFPRPAALHFMLRYPTRDALDMSLFTLRKMADGGIHDHVGGGFHRYSVDDSWHVPHFEKMLVDQAQLAESYLEAYQITHDAFHAGIARDILEYVLRDMTGSEGQFFSAEDADSPLPGNPTEHAEGAFYVWERREIAQALGDDAATVFNDHYGVEEDGNAPEDPHGAFRRKNILIVRRTLDETDSGTRTLLSESLLRLREVRARRPRPFLDDKTLTGWNGLMISALARAAQVLDEPRYQAAAIKAAGFVESRLWDAKNARLMRRARAGETGIPGFVDDYAFLIQGVIDLYEAGFDVKWLEWAIELQHRQDVLFWDGDGGGYFGTTGEDPGEVLRLKEEYDGAEPSPNSVAALNLLRLSSLAGSEAFRDRAETIFSAFGGLLRQVPSAMPRMLSALAFHLAPPRHIVVAGRSGAPDTQAMLREVHARFIPNKVILLADGGAGQETLAAHNGFIKGMRMIAGKATAYVCENGACRSPTNDRATLARLLAGE